MQSRPPTERRISGHKDYVGSVAFSPDGNRLASGSLDRSIILWKPQTGERVRTLSGHRYCVNSVAFSPDGALLASGAGQTFGLGEVNLWDVQSGSLIKTLVPDCDFVNAVTFSPDGSRLACSTGSGCGPREPIEPTITVLDVETGRVLFSLSRRNCAAFSPEGSFLAAGGPDSAIILVDSRTGTKHRTLEGHSGNVLSAACSSQGLLATGSVEVEGQDQFGAVKLWDVSTGEVQRTLRTHGKSVSHLVFAADGRLLGCGSPDSSIELWDTDTGELVTMLPHSSPENWGPHQFAFSPDGRSLASGGTDGDIRLWPLAD